MHYTKMPHCSLNLVRTPQNIISYLALAADSILNLSYQINLRCFTCLIFKQLNRWRNFQKKQNNLRLGSVRTAKSFSPLATISNNGRPINISCIFPLSKNVHYSSSHPKGSLQSYTTHRGKKNLMFIGFAQIAVKNNTYTLVISIITSVNHATGRSAIRIRGTAGTSNLETINI